jgi:hypothetical protein
VRSLIRDPGSAVPRRSSTLNFVYDVVDVRLLLPAEKARKGPAGRANGA